MIELSQEDRDMIFVVWFLTFSILAGAILGRLWGPRL